jgi:hypothetical protein
MDIDGGNFSGVDGLSFGPTGRYKNNFSLAASYLYKSGNIHYNFNVPTIDTLVDIISGDIYPFYQVTPTWSIETYNQDMNLVTYFVTGNNAVPFLKKSGIFYATRNEDFQIGASGLQGGNSVYSNIISPHQYIDGNGISYAASVDTVAEYTHTPYTFNASRDLLIVYNAENADSVSLKNYYTSIRTGLTGARQLGLTGIVPYKPSPFTGYGEIINSGDFFTRILEPLKTFRNTQMPTLKYIVLMYDLPITEEPSMNPLCEILSTGLGNMTGKYISYRLNIDRSGYRSALNGALHPFIPFRPFSLSNYYNTCLCTHISARTASDVSGYIRKLGTAKVSGHYLLSPYSNSLNTAILYFANPSGGTSIRPAFQEPYPPYQGLKLCSGIQGVNFDFGSPAGWVFPYVTGTDVSAFGFWGTNSVNNPSNGGVFGPNYNDNGYIRFTGKNWYIMAAAESYAGQMSSSTSNQGSVWHWLQKGSFYGTGWENCPVGGVGTTNEPSVAGIASWWYFALWLSGCPFIECANWGIGKYNTVHGDPFLKLR